MNTKAMVRSPNSDTDFFDIVAGVLPGDILAGCCLQIMFAKLAEAVIKYTN